MRNDKGEQRHPARTDVVSVMCHVGEKDSVTQLVGERKQETRRAQMEKPVSSHHRGSRSAQAEGSKRAPQNGAPRHSTVLKTIQWIKQSDVMRKETVNCNVQRAPRQSGETKNPGPRRTMPGTHMRVAQGVLPPSLARSGCWFMTPLMARMRTGHARYLRVRLAGMQIETW